MKDDLCCACDGSGFDADFGHIVGVCRGCDGTGVRRPMLRLVVGEGA